MRFGFILLLCGAAVAQAPVYKPAPIGTLKQVMRGVLLPNSDILFSVAQTVPKNDKEWAVVQDSAIALSESAALISMPGRLLSNGQKVPLERADWIKFTQELVDAGNASYKAAQSKNQDVMTVSLDRLSAACDSCHEVYRDKH
jgi:cytochrome c556